MQIILNLLNNVFDANTQAKFVFFFIFFSFMVPELYPWFNWKRTNCDFHSFTLQYRTLQLLQTVLDHNTQVKFNIGYYVFYGSCVIPFVYFMQKRGHPCHMDTFFHVKANCHRSSYMSLSQSLMARYELEAPRSMYSSPGYNNNISQ